MCATRQRAPALAESRPPMAAFTPQVGSAHRAPAPRRGSATAHREGQIKRWRGISPLPCHPLQVHAVGHWRRPQPRPRPELAELPVSLRQPQNIMPPSTSLLLADDNPANVVAGACSHELLDLPDEPKSTAAWKANLPVLGCHLGSIPRALRPRGIGSGQQWCGCALARRGQGTLRIQKERRQCVLSVQPRVTVSLLAGRSGGPGRAWQ